MYLIIWAFPGLLRSSQPGRAIRFKSSLPR